MQAATASLPSGEPDMSGAIRPLHAVRAANSLERLRRAYPPRPPDRPGPPAP
ncbi:hypothetical protein GCM10009779_29750 [Polymorphospora rubra]|uniref:Uncharacterized protein n=1 Tax=Polymorphospora rubra TaxID=338584 RepID=A0A810N5P7_9ACTN|nr:hypothetical protein Prubr_45300 [Polymorphospora rubra]